MRIGPLGRKIPFEVDQIPVTPCIQPIHHHPWLDDIDNNPVLTISLVNIQESADMIVHLMKKFMKDPPDTILPSS